MTQPLMPRRAVDDSGANSGRAHLWTIAVVAASLPFLLTLCFTLWHAPYQLSESVSIFDDVARQPASAFLVPTTSYYRPFFFVALSSFWHGAGSLDGTLGAIRLLHIVPVTLLVLLLIWQLRPRTALDAAAGTVAVAVLVGSPGFLDNLELPLSYTIVGMSIALIVWMLLERERRPWNGLVIVGLTLVAIGFKEQGLVVVPLVVVAWWTGAPGTSRATATSVVTIAIAYVGFRLVLHDPSLPLFEQDVGLGFDALSPEEALTRFGSFPLWIYVYSGVSTTANVLFAEPSGGVFRIIHALSEGEPRPWHFVYLFSSLFMTGLIAWWGIGTLQRTSGHPWSPESRLFIVTIVVLAACGTLSFAYSRDRLSGMAVPFYALAAFFAVRTAALRAAQMSRTTAASSVVALLLLAGAWQLRATYTVEFTRQRAENSHREWMTEPGQRRVELAGRTEYLRIMDEMIDQGTAPSAVEYTRYPRWMVRLFGEY